MVERNGGGGDSPSVPTIADLLIEYRRRTGASYDDMSKAVHGEITTAWFHKLTTQPPKSFPRDAATVAHLADLLQVSVTTVLVAFAVALGLPVESSGSHLAITLPPGSDVLDSRDVEAVRSVIRQLVDARRMAAPPVPDLAVAEGMRLATDDLAARRRADTPNDG